MLIEPNNIDDQQDLLLDVSAITELICARRYQIRIVHGYSETNDAALWGSAVHSYMECVDLHDLPNAPSKGTPNALDHAAKYHVANIGNLILACSTLSTLPRPPVLFDINGKPLVEWKFAFHYKTVNNIRIILCGTVDRIDSPIPGYIRFLDYKTTGKFKIDEVLADYTSRLQVYFYMLMIRDHLIQYLPADIADPIAANKFYGQLIGIFRSHNPVAIRPSNRIELTNELVADMYAMLDDFIDKALAIHNLGTTLAYPEGMAYNICCHCPYDTLCSIRNKDQITAILRKAVQDKPQYNPLTHR